MGKIEEIKDEGCKACGEKVEVEDGMCKYCRSLMEEFKVCDEDDGEYD